MGEGLKNTATCPWNRGFTVCLQPYLKHHFFSKTIPRDRFRQILSALHFTSNENSNSADRLFKLRSVIDSCAQTIASDYAQTIFVPNRDICVDKSLVKFHGRLSFKPFNPSKRARFGIKIYKLSHSSGNSAAVTSAVSKYIHDKIELAVKILWAPQLSWI